MLKRGMPPVHPGNVLKEMYLDPLEVSVTDFADNIGVARKTVSQLINEHSGVSAEMALRLSAAFDTTPEMWLNMQQKYDLWEAEKNVKLTKIKHLTVRTRPMPTTTVVRAAAATSGKFIGTSKGKGITAGKVAAARKATAKDGVTKQ